MDKKQEIREAAEADLKTFIQLVHPKRVLGSIHREAIDWMCRPDHKSHQILMLPRDHQKSALIGYRSAWAITKNPAIRILYLSSTSGLAIKQVKFIKDILTSRIYRRYWPDMINEEEGKREKWTEAEFSVDHPKRKEENIRDATVMAGGMTTSVTGFHCDVSVFDDVVVDENTYTEDGREKLRAQYSLLASIEGTDAEQWVAGTRYHPEDLYSNMLEMVVDTFDANGEITGSEPLYEVFRDGEVSVEDQGDGTGEFLWPRQIRSDGKAFGFNKEILARKFAQYLDKAKFYSQYYNDPNRDTSAAIQRTEFQTYNRKFLNRDKGAWYFKGHRLNLLASVDFAYAEGKKNDYTTIVVCGVDSDGNYYVLDIDRFQTSKISDYFAHILALHTRWDFRKIVCEVTAAQSVIVNDLKQNYIARNGLALSIIDFRPDRTLGKKQERIQAILQPRYNNRQIWHYEGGNCQILEEELSMSRPPHDDVKDALATCIHHLVQPGPTFKKLVQVQTQNYHPRFGGFI